MTSRAELEARLRDADEILEVEPAPEADTAAHSIRLQMWLESAALAAELQLGDKQVRDRLAGAGRAALAVFGAPRTQVGDLDTGQVTPDSSSANPLTLLYGLYAALAAADPATARSLAELAPGETHTKQIEASPAVSATARAVQAAVLGDREATERLATEALQTVEGGDSSYPAELQALAAWATASGDPDQVVEAVRASVRASAGVRGGTDEPAIRLELPARGLRGLFTGRAG